VTQNEPGGIVALTANLQEILTQALRQIEFASSEMVTRLPMWDPEKLRRQSEALARSEKRLRQAASF